MIRNREISNASLDARKTPKKNNDLTKVEQGSFQDFSLTFPPLFVFVDADFQTRTPHTRKRETNKTIEERQDPQNRFCPHFLGATVVLMKGEVAPKNQVDNTTV